MSDFELSIFDKYDKIFLYFRFLYSGFSRFKLTSFKLKSNLGDNLFLSDIEITLLLTATLRR